MSAKKQEVFDDATNGFLMSRMNNLILQQKIIFFNVAKKLAFQCCQKCMFNVAKKSSFNVATNGFLML